MSARDVWGKVVLYLKEHKKVALHIACGDITNARLEDGKLIIRSSDEFLIDVLENGRKDIESAIRWQGLDLKFVVEKFESGEQKINKDISARDVSIILQGLLVGNIQMKLGKKLLNFILKGMVLEE